MFQLDNNFLESVGLGSMPEEQKQAFLQHIYGELELRVGTKLSEGLNDAQLAEFESFMPKPDRTYEEAAIRDWLNKNQPDYQASEEFQAFRNKLPTDVPEIAVLSEFASLKWLALNRPDYKQVVAGELNALKAEIVSNREAILGGQTAEAGEQTPPTPPPAA